MADDGGPSAREELFHRTLLELGGTRDSAEQADFCRRSDIGKLVYAEGIFFTPPLLREV